MIKELQTAAGDNRDHLLERSIDGQWHHIGFGHPLQVPVLHPTLHLVPQGFWCPYILVLRPLLSQTSYTPCIFCLSAVNHFNFLRRFFQNIHCSTDMRGRNSQLPRPH